MRYDPLPGIVGIDFYVVVKCSGTRVSCCKHESRRIGNRQKISQEDVQEWFKKTYDGVFI